VSFVLTCGKLYENPRNVMEIQDWLNRYCIFSTADRINLFI
jgi:hypothetical protein